MRGEDGSLIARTAAMTPAYDGDPGYRQAMTEAGRVFLLTTARRYLNVLIIVVWNNLRPPEQEDARLHR